MKLSKNLQELYTGIRGFSVRSLERFCAQKNIHRTSGLQTNEVDIVVAGAVAKVSYMPLFNYSIIASEIFTKLFTDTMYHDQIRENNTALAV